MTSSHADTSGAPARPLVQDPGLEDTSDADAAAAMILALSPAAQDGALRGTVGKRSWQAIQANLDQTAGALRRIPGRFGAKSLAALRKLARVDPDRVLGLLRRGRILAPRSAFLAQGVAMMTARAKGWEAAEPLFLEARARKTPGAATALLRARPTPAIWPALPAPDRPALLDEDQAAGIVIYTAAFGTDPGPMPLFHGIPGLRFLCLTDRPDLDVPGWRTVLVTPEDIAPDRLGAWARILPHRALDPVAPGITASLYLAPDRKLVGNLNTLMLRWLLPHKLVFWRATTGIDWRDMAEHRLIGADTGGAPEAVAPRDIIAQARDCATLGLPVDRGGQDTGMIWRRHAVPEVTALMEAWWRTDGQLRGLDSISLYATLNDPASSPDGAPDWLRILPADLGSANNNAFVAASPPRPARRAHAPVPAGRPLPVAFLYAEEYAGAGSTVLRGQQLSQLVAAQYPESVDMLYTSDASLLRDRVVILTKGAIQTNGAEAIADLRKRNIAVIGSWDDMLPEADRMAAMDATMAVSNRQAHDFGRLFPGTPSYHVTHHVNSLIKPMSPPTDRARTAYFGFPANTHRPDSLGHLVDFVGLDTRNLEMSWIDLLPRYNCHWIIRRSKAHDGWKPFLKGFVAARCQAVVAVGREDEDAVQYLGDDYPFYLRGTDHRRLEYDMMALASAFGGPEWRRAREIMAQVAARSTDAQVCAEFRAMVRDVIG